MQSLQPYHNSYEGAPAHLQDKAKQLCREYNQTAPREEERRRAILQQLFGSYNPQTFIEPSFHCDYGFNIHTHGLAFLNYNCVILDTSPVHIGAGVFIAPACVLLLGACNRSGTAGRGHRFFRADYNRGPRPDRDQCDRLRRVSPAKYSAPSQKRIS